MCAVDSEKVLMSDALMTSLRGRRGRGEFVYRCIYDELTRCEYQQRTVWRIVLRLETLADLMPMLEELHGMSGYGWLQAPKGSFTGYTCRGVEVHNGYNDMILGRPAPMRPYPDSKDRRDLPDHDQGWWVPIGGLEEYE